MALFIGLKRGLVLRSGLVIGAMCLISRYIDKGRFRQRRQNVNIKLRPQSQNGGLWKIEIYIDVEGR